MNSTSKDTGRCRVNDTAPQIAKVGGLQVLGLNMGTQETNYVQSCEVGGVLRTKSWWLSGSGALRSVPCCQSRFGNIFRLLTFGESQCQMVKEVCGEESDKNQESKDSPDAWTGRGRRISKGGGLTRGAEEKLGGGGGAVPQTKEPFGTKR